MSIQQSLNEEYARRWTTIEKLRHRNSGLSAPILIKVPASYSCQKVKLMIIGQQTMGWGDGDINDLLKCYENFNFGEAYYPSPFWNLTRKIEKSLGIDRYAIVWSNLNRCDFNDDRPPREVEADLAELAELLSSEVNILKPDVMIFFSGPCFDEHIKNTFSGSRFAPVEEFKDRELSRVEHESLPFHAYRTYHPKYLRMSGIEPRFIEYIEGINT